MNQKPNFKFSVDSQLISELGERLVTSNYIALSELIKNAYDADSPSVDIKFFNISDVSVKEEERKIVIEDSGIGMTKSDIKKFWMTIATPHKAKSPKSKKYGRPTTGNKGIGRFACQRLAKKLIIESCARVGNQYEKTEVVFEWDKFVPGKKVEKIPCQYTSRKTDTGKTGVTLNLIGLRDRWTFRDYQMLQKYVALISIATQSKREGYLRDPGFQANIECSEYESKSFNIGKKTLEAGWGTLKGEITSKGRLNLSLSCAPDNKLKRYFLENEKYKKIQHVSFEIHIMPKSSHLGVENRREPKFLTQSLISEIWDTHSGIKLYLNRFRVYPYGDLDAGDDWLGIAKDVSRRRAVPDPILKEVSNKMGVLNFNRAMLNQPSARAHIGSVFINEKAADAFEAKMDREGLIENDAFTELKKVLKISLDWAALNYEAFLRSEISKKVEAKKKEFLEVSGLETQSTKKQLDHAFKIIDKAADDLSKNKKFNNQSQQKLDSDSIESSEGSQLSAAVNFLETQFNEFDAEIDTLRSVAATAPLLFVFSHEFKGIMTSLLSHAVMLEETSKSVADLNLKESLTSMAKHARDAVDQHEEIMLLFEVFSDSQNFHKKKVFVKRAIDRVLGGFSYLFSEFDIVCDPCSNIDGTLRMPKLNQSEFYSILINAISNSVKAVISRSGEKKIKIEVVSSDMSFDIFVSDTGVGLNESRWEEVFEPFISDPEGKIYSTMSTVLGDQQLSTLGKGSGLGLHIMRTIAKKHNGNVAFIEPDEGWNAKLYITIPNK